MLMRGALVEYGSNFLGPLPNIVVFQFNPEQIARTLAIPQRPSSGGTRAARTPNSHVAAAPPTESFTLTAHFSAADDLGRGGALSVVPRAFGIAPQLAALEKMVYPTKVLAGLLGLGGAAAAKAVDAVGGALGKKADKKPKPVPPEKLPRLLFIWGPTRVLPVQIKSLSITEQKFDFLLNPVQAEVQIGLDVVRFGPGDDDKLGQGALDYTTGVKEAQAALNLVKAVELALDIIPF